MAIVEIINLTKSFKDIEVIHNTSSRIIIIKNNKFIQSYM